jgi:hypothetical protein
MHSNSKSTVPWVILASLLTLQAAHAQPRPPDAVSQFPRLLVALAIRADPSSIKRSLAMWSRFQASGDWRPLARCSTA